MFVTMIAAAALLAAPASAEVPAKPPTNLYDAYAFLIGEWDVAPPGGEPVAIERFRWGANQSYIWFSVATLGGGKEEPHFEGMLMWNGPRRNLDMLVALDLHGGRAQEQGVMSIEPDGTVVREITAYYSEGVRLPPRGEVTVGPAGAALRFRQTFKAEGPDRVVTALTRESAEGWVPTFPGSDRLLMTRRRTG